MKIDFFAHLDSCIDSMSHQLSQHEHPILLLDDDRILRYRNKSADMRTVPIRIGTRIDNFLSQEDLAAIKALNPGELADVDLKLPSVFGTSMVRGNGFFVLVCSVVTVSLRRHINEIMSLIPGYQRQMYISAGGNACSDGESNRSVLRFYAHLTEYLRILAGSPRDQKRPFSVTAVSEGLFDLAREYLAPACFTVGVGKIRYGLFSKGSEQDFAMILSVMLSVSLLYGVGTGVSVSVDCNNGKISFETVFDSCLDAEDLEKLSAGRFENGDFLKENGELMFDVYLLGLIADCNLWDFSVKTDPAVWGRAVFRLELCEHKYETEPLLRDPKPEYLKEILLRELSVLQRENAWIKNQAQNEKIRTQKEINGFTESFLEC